MVQKSDPIDPDSHQLISASRELVDGSRERITSAQRVLGEAHHRLHDTRNVLQHVLIARLLRGRKKQ
jgi:hypothetical protein